MRDSSGTTEPRVTMDATEVSGTRPRILVVAPQPFYEDRGTPIALRQVLGALGELGYPTDLLTYPVGRTIELPGVRYVRGPNPMGFGHVPIGFSWRKVVLDAVLAPTLARLLRSRSYGCVHAVEEAAYLAALLRPRGVPLLYDMQSSLPEQMERQVHLPPGSMPLLRATERWLLRRADLVVASAGLAPLARAQVPQVRVREWTFSSVLPDASAGEVERVRQELDLCPSRRVILYAGNFAAYQGTSALLEAIPEIVEAAPDACFVLVGASEEEAARVRASQRERVASGHVRVVRRQPRERISAYLEVAEFCVSPRAWGANLPLKVFEYLAAGRPLVATDIPAHRSLLGDDHALLVESSAQGLRDGILRLLSDRELADRLARAGREHADGHFGWTAFVDDVRNHYAEILGLPENGEDPGD